jgi:hypothetical protein
MPENNASTDSPTVQPKAEATSASAREQPAPSRRGSPLSRTDACASTRCGVARILLFFGLFVGLLYVTHFAITTGLRRVETAGFGVTNRIVNGQVNADIVISGSSRAQTHYDPRIIAQATGLSTYNIGRNGSQTDLQLAVLKTYLQHNRKPKLIIHNLDSFSFVTSKEIYDPAQYIPYLSEAPIYEAVKKVYPDAWKWKYFPLYAYVVTDMRFAWLTGVKRWLGINPREDHIDGFTPRFTQWTGDFGEFKKQNPEGVKFEIEPVGVKDLTELALLCRSHGIPLLFVYSPVYLEMQLLERNRPDIFTTFTKIGMQFGAKLWDFSASSIAAKQSNFYNSQHLNADGAQQFSSEFAQKLEKSSAFPR